MDRIADRDALDAALDFRRAGFTVASIAIPDDDGGDLEITLANGPDKLTVRVSQRLTYQAATDELDRLVEWHARQGRLRLKG